MEFAFIIHYVPSLCFYVQFSVYLCHKSHIVSIFCQPSSQTDRRTEHVEISRWSIIKMNILFVALLYIILYLIGPYITSCTLFTRIPLSTKYRGPEHSKLPRYPLHLLPTYKYQGYEERLPRFDHSTSDNFIQSVINANRCKMRTYQTVTIVRNNRWCQMMPVEGRFSYKFENWQKQLLRNSSANIFFK